MAVKQVFNTSAELDFPNVLPTLDLDFANSKTLDPRITFTRASGGSYVGADGLIKYAGVNEARFDHDPETGESLGLLIEEARTNNVVSSQDFTTLWFPNGSSRIISNAILSPSGNLDGSKYVEAEVNQENYIRSSARTLSAGTYTASVYVHESSERRLWLRPVHIGSTHATSSVIFDPKTKTLGSPIGFGISASATNAGGGWWRVSLTFTTPDTRNIQHGIHAITSTAVYTGDGTSGLYIWGAQLEQGAFPTSYIPTQASTRTRAADIASITGKNFSEWYRQIGYTIFSEHITGRPSSVFPRVFNISTSTDSFRLNHYQPPQANYVGFSAVDNNINFADIRYFNITQSVKAKMATSYDFNNVVLYVNGDFVGRDITNPYPSQNRDRINIGSATPSGSYINSTISKITYYPYPLKDSNLQSLTS
jgi:hypothetical protein